MSKKITSFFLALVVLLGMMAAIPVAAVESGTGTVVIKADTATASPGDTIRYTVTLGPIANFDTAEFQMVIPDGLTFVDGALDENLKETLENNRVDDNSPMTMNYDTEDQSVFILAVGGYTSEVDTVLLSFTCTVDEDCALNKDLVMDFDYSATFYFDDYDAKEIAMTVTTATVSITCAHKDTTTTPAVASTCTEQGNEEYVTCNTCGEIISGSDEKLPLAEHTYEWVIDKPATATEPGLRHLECSVCDDKQEAVEYTCEHKNVSYVEGTAPTCEEAGTAGYYVCDSDICAGVKYADENCAVIVTDEDLVVEALGHTYAPVEEVPSTCQKQGTAAHQICEVCGKLFDLENNEITAPEKLPLADHDVNTEEWTKNSLYHWHACANCSERIEKAEHVYGDDYVCDICGYEKTVIVSGGTVTVYYDIIAEAGENGTISPAGESSVIENGTKTYTITPDDGYVVADVKVDGQSVGAVTTYTFDNISADHEIEATFKWDNPFTDVSEDDDCYEAVKYVYENGLFIGTSDTEFSPNVTMTRSMFATVLARLAGVTPTYEGASQFSDAVTGEWYVPYIEWAAEEGLMLGYGDGAFGVTDEITVEQAAIIMTRYADYCGIDTASSYTFASFTDANEISEWAVEQMKWVVENGVYTGSGSELNPTDLATRALVAEMINLYVEKYAAE